MSSDSVANPHSQINSEPTGAAVKPGLKMQIVYGQVYVKAYPELGRAAIAAGLSTPFRIWTLLRAIDPDGSGVIGLDAGMQCLAFYDLNRWHVRNALKVQRENGVQFFTVTDKKFEYSSLYNVALALKVERALTPVLIRTDDCHKLSRFNSAVYAAWLFSIRGQNGAVMISRAKLAELWKRTDTQLRKWEKIQKKLYTTDVIADGDDHKTPVKRFKVKHNAVAIDAPQGDAVAALEREFPSLVDDRRRAAIPRDGRLSDERLGRAYTWQRDGRTYYQTVNSYRVTGNYTCSPSFARKAAKRVRHALKQVAAVEDVATAKDKPQRVFFSRDYLDGKDWQLSVDSSALLETKATISGQRKYQGRRGQPVVRKVQYHVWEFSAMRPTPKENVL